MWRSKKLVIASVLAGVLLVGSIGGIVLAADNEGGSQPETSLDTLWDKVCEIYQQKTGVTIDQGALKDAFIQAQSEMRIEALRNRLQSLVEQGKLTQEQADQYLEWWQAKPDVPEVFGFRGPCGFRGMGGPPAPPE